MKFKLNNRFMITLALLASALLAGCSTTKTMYGWNEYQPEIYAYFQGSDVDKQIITLEKNLEQFKARDTLAPPGFHAHLGMLYAQVGNMGRAEQEFITEKKLFPESASYMDFLLQKKDISKTVATKQNDGGSKNTVSDVANKVENKATNNTKKNANNTASKSNIKRQEVSAAGQSITANETTKREQ